MWDTNFSSIRHKEAKKQLFLLSVNNTGSGCPASLAKAW